MPMMCDKKFCVVGIGYVGLPCAVMLASAGCKVLGVDIDKEYVKSINNGTACVEDGLSELLLSPRVRENLIASTKIESADVFIIAVPTPIDHRKKIADLSALKNAARSVASAIKKGDLVIIESTVPPLSLRDILAPIFYENGMIAGEDFYLAHCPERLLPGNIVYEIIYNNRIIGGITAQSAQRAADVYRLFVKGAIALTDDVTAELCKLIENAYRDVNIALANELSEVCADIGVNINEAIDLANMHPRVSLLKPGIGVGGHCLPIDPWFIHEVSPYNSTMIRTARLINDARPLAIAAKIRAMISADMTQDILILGKTYKEETNDVRESPALRIIEMLRADGYRISSYDPFVDTSVSLKEIASSVRYIFVLVSHKQLLKELDELISEYRKSGKSEPRVVFYSPQSSAENTTGLIIV